ncbi:pyrroline-5-carboxylate reductase [Aurantimonas sp. MSK8Z-1]|uniref:pyrroline-5-carboxylate reductase n=1 Tax=Mangrovibrevibacter kandeliae TaxID=2968473 RepID=UPI002117EE49|nr:pyrroline-5-carboxylate reductase [Aurantimonas sp. MSK8Z-1]MCW4113813.1 pyrroline-5-carboxylate reductase [Aurantimonas sp. MSK8Z-1]
MSALRILLLGGGNMGGALARGWFAGGGEALDVTLVDPKLGDAIRPLVEAGSVRHAQAVPAETADVVVVAVKPQMMDAALPALKPAIGSSTLVVSIAAGTPIAAIERHLGEAAVVRAMPNTPALIGRGITGCFGNARVGEAEQAVTEQLLAGCGPVEWVGSEALIDAVTAVSGSGPAYVFYLTEALAEAGAAAGLDLDLAMRLARATVSGAGELMRQSDETPARLRQNVTSPNGTTAAALGVLMAAEGGLAPLMREAVAAAKRRAEELSQG